jgi:hypothetical protein
VVAALLLHRVVGLDTQKCGAIARNVEASQSGWFAKLDVHRDEIDVNAALAVSPDGTTILYTRVVNDGADLMMTENFR